MSVRPLSLSDYFAKQEELKQLKKEGRIFVWPQGLTNKGILEDGYKTEKIYSGNWAKERRVERTASASRSTAKIIS